MRLMRRRIMQAKACAQHLAKSCEATLCSVTGNFVLLLQNPQNYESCLIKKKEEYHGRTL